MISTPVFVFGAKSQKRLLVISDLVCYYDMVGRDVTAANVCYTHVGKSFETQWKALKARKDGGVPDVPKITKALPIIKWSKSFRDFLSRVIGVRIIPLAYVIREQAIVPGVAPALVDHHPHSHVHGSVENEMVHRASHTHALYRDNNQEVYNYMEEATSGMPYAASIKPFQRGKDGRGTWMALIAHYAGKDK